jgi:hypothetical protein
MYGERSAAIDRLRYVKNGAFHVFVTFIATDWDLSELRKIEKRRFLLVVESQDIVLAGSCPPDCGVLL